VLSDGRFELGVGAGWAEYEYQWAGIPFDVASIRIARLEEYVQVLRALLSPGLVNYQGQFFSISDMPGAEAGGLPGPQLMLGGFGDRMLGLAARHADIVNINMVGKANANPATMDAKVALVRDKAASPDRLQLSTMIVMAVVSEEPRRTALDSRLRHMRAAGETVPDGGLDLDGLLTSPSVLVGTVASIEEQLLAQRERWGISYYAISYPDLELFAPVVARLAGR
jgi:alkanesulfonate monooxygenase SsuD/methylene tetrahydromethanopterin reductase-like flavin-dependent oxidoreductase (luciferase family)